MTFLSTVSDCWLGLCRKAPVVCASHTGIGVQPKPAHEGSPDGGAGGPGTIRRGIGAALSGTKTLIHNRDSSGSRSWSDSCWPGTSSPSGCSSFSTPFPPMDPICSNHLSWHLQ